MSKQDLKTRCQVYLEQGPPSSMDDYVPESLTEIIIAHGAQETKLDDELLEVASIILMEGEDFTDILDSEVRSYMLTGSQLVEEVLQQQS